MQVVHPCRAQTAGLVDDNEGIGEVMQKNVDLLQAFLKSLLMVLTSQGQPRQNLLSHSKPSQDHRLMTAADLQILVTELGDETFIIAAIMAMRHPRLVVYVGAMTALVSMTVSWNAFCLWDSHQQHPVCCLYKVSKSALAQDAISSTAKPLCMALPYTEFECALTCVIMQMTRLLAESILKP